MTTLFGDLILKLFRDNGAYEIHDFGDATDVLIEVMTEEVFNNYNPEVRMAVEAKEVWTTDEFWQINTVLAEGVDEFGYDLIKDKDFIQRIELYVYLQAKEMGIELAEELKTKQEERQAEVRQPIKVEQRTTEVSELDLEHTNHKLKNHINGLERKLRNERLESSKQAHGLHEENKELKRKLKISDELIKELKKQAIPIQEALNEHEADLQQLHQEEMDTLKEKYEEEEGEKIEDLTQHYNEKISDLKDELESYEEDGCGWENIRDTLREEIEEELTGDLATHIGTYIRERNWS